MTRGQIRKRMVCILLFMMTFLGIWVISPFNWAEAAGKAVVKCDGQEYDSLKTALESAGFGSTITLLQDVSIEPGSIEISKDLILDLNQHKLSAMNQEEGHLHYLLIQNGGTLTIRNGTLYGKGMMGISAEEDSILNLEEVRIQTTDRALNIKDNAKVMIDQKTSLVTESDDSTIMIISQYDGLDWGKRPYLEVNGTVVNQTEKPAISGHGNDSGKTHITIGNGAKIQSKGTAIFQPQNGTLTINEAKIAGASGVEVRQGILTINDGAEITGNDELGYLADPESLDPCTNSAAITIAEKPRKGQIRVYINGGKFIGDAALCSVILEDHATTRLTHQPKKAKDPITAYVRVEDGIFDGDIFDYAGCFYGITTCGQFKTNPAWQVKGFTLQIYEFTGKNTGWFYVGEAAQKRLETANPGTKFDLVCSGDLENVKSGLVLVDKQVWDVIVNHDQVVTNGRSITVK